MICAYTVRSVKVEDQEPRVEEGRCYTCEISVGCYNIDWSDCPRCGILHRCQRFMFLESWVCVASNIADGGRTSRFPGRTRASLPRYRQISAVMTSRSIPSRGIKYSFARRVVTGGGARVPRPAMVRDKLTAGKEV